MTRRDTRVTHPEAPEDRALRWAVEDTIGDLAWQEFEREGGMTSAENSHDARRRYLAKLDRLSAEAGTRYGRRP